MKNLRMHKGYACVIDHDQLLVASVTSRKDLSVEITRSSGVATETYRPTDVYVIECATFDELITACKMREPVAMHIDDQTDDDAMPVIAPSTTSIN